MIQHFDKLSATFSSLIYHLIKSCHGFDVDTSIV
jgi:hypothetical protein